METSTPNPQLVTLVFTVIRSLLTIAGAVGVTVGAYSDSTLMLLAGGIVALGTAIWSLVEKFQAAREAHSRAVQSALLGKAVKP